MEVNSGFGVVTVVTCCRGYYIEVHAGVYRGFQVAVKTIFDGKEESPEMQGFQQEAAILT